MVSLAFPVIHPRGVDDAYQILGLKRGLVISEEELRVAFRDAGKMLHPDAGGGEGEFAALREALALLSSPSRRLAHWLALHGAPMDPRGSIDPAMMDLFTGIGKTTQMAETVIRKRDEAKSALAKAMLEGETLAARESVENEIATVDAWIVRECSVFPVLEAGGEFDPAKISATVRNLGFLEKWRAGLRSCFSRLI